MPCLGNGEDHCCYIKGKPCPFLIFDYIDETGHFRKWACSLRAKYGNWDDVLADPEYQRATEGAWAPGVNCRDWPDGEGWNAGPCSKCGANS
jgi:hypothetical protein